MPGSRLSGLARAVVAAACLGGGASEAIPLAASAQTETALSEAGWAASSNPSSGSADAPANAIDGNVNNRLSSDADQASGMWFQVNLGSSQTFNQIEMDAGGSSGDY